MTYNDIFHNINNNKYIVNSHEVQRSSDFDAMVEACERNFKNVLVEYIIGVGANNSQAKKIIDFAIKFVKEDIIEYVRDSYVKDNLTGKIIDIIINCAPNRPGDLNTQITQRQILAIIKTFAEVFTLEDTVSIKKNRDNKIIDIRIETN